MLFWYTRIAAKVDFLTVFVFARYNYYGIMFEKFGFQPVDFLCQEAVEITPQPVPERIPEREKNVVKQGITQREQYPVQMR